MNSICTTYTLLYLTMKAARGLTFRSFNLLFGMRLLRLAISLELLIIHYLKKEVTTQARRDLLPSSASQGEPHPHPSFEDSGACCWLLSCVLDYPNPSLSTPVFSQEAILMIPSPIVRS